MTPLQLTTHAAEQRTEGVGKEERKGRGEVGVSDGGWKNRSADPPPPNSSQWLNNEKRKKRDILVSIKLSSQIMFFPQTPCSKMLSLHLSALKLQHTGDTWDTNCNMKPHMNTLTEFLFSFSQPALPPSL